MIQWFNDSLRKTRRHLLATQNYNLLCIKWTEDLQFSIILSWKQIRVDCVNVWFLETDKTRRVKYFTLTFTETLRVALSARVWQNDEKPQNGLFTGKHGSDIRVPSHTLTTLFHIMIDHLLQIHIVLSAMTIKNEAHQNKTTNHKNPHIPVSYNCNKCGVLGTQSWSAVKIWKYCRQYDPPVFTSLCLFPAQCGNSDPFIIMTVLRQQLLSGMLICGYNGECCYPQPSVHNDHWTFFIQIITTVYLIQVYKNKPLFCTVQLEMSITLTCFTGHGISK